MERAVLLLDSIILPSETKTRSLTAQQVVPCAIAIASAAIEQTFLNCESPKNVDPRILLRSSAPTAYTIICPSPIILLAHAEPNCCFSTGSVSTIKLRQVDCTILMIKSSR